IDHNDVELPRIALAQERPERRADRGLRIVGVHDDGDFHAAPVSRKMRTAAAISAGSSLRSRWNAGNARAIEAIRLKSSRQLPLSWWRLLGARASIASLALAGRNVDDAAFAICGSTIAFMARRSARAPATSASKSNSILPCQFGGPSRAPL